MKKYSQKIACVCVTAILSIFTFPTFAANNVIDVLVVYTKGVADLYGGNPTTRINQLFQVTNQIYADSGVDLEIRVANTLQVAYTDDNDAGTALNNITFNQHAAFSGVAAAREQAKADMVIFYRPYMNSHGSCGIAWIGGGANGVFSAAHRAYMFAHVAINTCGDFVTAHELGHNMGLKHSRKQDGVGGTFHYALGHGVVNSFATIMAYQNEFNVDYWTGKVYKFSNPDINTCKNQPCGVVRTDTVSGADARYALNVAVPQIAAFYAGTPLAASSSSLARSSVAISSSRSSSSVSTISVSELAARVEAARLAHLNAVAAVAANKLAIAERTASEKVAKTELAAAVKTLATVTKNYQTSVTTYNSLVVRISAMQSQLTDVFTAYNSTITASAKSAKLNQYNNLVARYNALLEQAAVARRASLAAQQQLLPATNAVTAATAKYNAAVSATAAEKAKTAALIAAVTNALTAYRALQTQYRVAQKTGGR
jgi:hypothetical protein